MSTVGTDGTYRNENTVRFTDGSLRLILDQSTPLLPAEARRVGTQADNVMGQMVCGAFPVGSSISDYIEKYQVRRGSSSTAGANWQEVGKLHLRIRLTISVEFAVPEFILGEAAELALKDFRRIVAIEMDPSYRAFVAEEKARKAATDLVSSLSPAAFMAAMLVGENAGLGLDGSGGMIVSGYPFGPFGDGNGFGRKG